jgi:hypothetical protein
VHAELLQCKAFHHAFFWFARQSEWTTFGQTGCCFTYYLHHTLGEPVLYVCGTIQWTILVFGGVWGSPCLMVLGSVMHEQDIVGIFYEEFCFFTWCAQNGRSTQSIKLLMCRPSVTLWISAPKARVQQNFWITHCQQEEQSVDASTG